MKIIGAAFAIGLAAVSSAQAASVLLDDFNDNSTAGWTGQNGSVSESGGQMFSAGNGIQATLDGATGSAIAADVISGNGVSYVGLILNFASTSDRIMVKIQDNNNNGLFDRVFFYGALSVTTGGFFADLSSEAASGLFSVQDNGNGTLTAAFDTTGDSFTVGYTANTGALQGSGIGLEFYGGAAADNFYSGTGMPTSEVPLPASALLLGGGLFGLAGAAARRRVKA